ncbi:hypothetical protein [Terribacillus saccharophilus]|uniref:hypothetical protein n=1 Tax=Terribacillus saccharophilus TaxID=361277 RepID=UPI002989F792|nr:hypothetical protein [Terribacillus saccharophilus]MCM3227714.1 hypothetical protein [Terribacillus saccharophilus]
MKKSVEMIYENFPKIQSVIENQEQDLNNLGEIEKVFSKMASFFLDPQNKSFDLKEVYTSLQDDWLVFAFECIETFFKNDSYLLKSDYSSLILEEHDPLVNQKGFSDILNETGIFFTKQKVNTYYSRDKLPKPEVIISGLPYWKKSVVLEYGENQKRKQEEK